MLTGVGVKEGVTETTVKVEQNKGRLLMHMLEGKRGKGPQRDRDFINKMLIKLGLKSSPRFQQT